jgi:hypothetical protein
MGGGAGTNTGAGGLLINSPTSFAQALLASLGIQATPANLQAVTAWEAAEGGNWNNTAAYNPLNTTLQLPGSVNYETGKPGPGVQAYQSWAQGVQATQDTLEQSNPAYGYSNILSALQSSAGTPALSQAVGSSKWGTGYFAGGSGSSTTGTAATLTAATTPFGGISGTAPAAPSGSVLNVGSDVVWLGQFAAWTVFTALVFLFGLILILLGMVMLGVVLLGPVVGPAGDLLPGPVGRLARSGKGSSTGAPARTVAAVRGPSRPRGQNPNRLFEQRRSLQEQRHEHRMTEIEHRGSVRRSLQGRPRSDPYEGPDF